jgi:hypothetical protein
MINIGIDIDGENKNNKIIPVTEECLCPNY